MSSRLFRKISSLSINKKLLYLAVLTLVIFMVVFESVQLIYMKEYVMNQQELSMQKIHKQSTELINAAITGSARAMDGLSASPVIIDFIAESKDFDYNSSSASVGFYSQYIKFNEMVNNVLYTYDTIDSINVYTRSGFIYDENTRVRFSREDMEKTDWYRYMTDNNVIGLWCDNRYLSDAETVQQDELYFIKLIPSDSNYNEFVGAIRISINKRHILDIIESQEINNTSFLRNSRGENLVFSGVNFENDFYDGVFAHNSASDDKCEELRYKGKNYLVISNSIDYTDWSFVNVVNTDVFLKAYITRAMILVGIMLVVFLFVIFFMNLSWKYVTRRLTMLINTINKTDIDNLVTIDIGHSDDDVGVCIESYNKMVRRIEVMFEEILENKKRLQNIEMDMLYAQLNPHFLFNTLSIINSMAIEQRAYDIQKVIEHLSNYYRFALQNKSNLITLQEELEHEMIYVELCNRRFSKNICFVWDVPEELLDTKVLKMLFQPVIENSVIHGFLKSDSESEQNMINLVAYSKGEYIYVELMDNGIGINSEKLKSLMDDERDTGIGIANTEKRLKLYYGNDCGLQIDSEEGSYTRVTYTFTKIHNEEPEDN